MGKSTDTKAKKQITKPAGYFASLLPLAHRNRREEKERKYNSGRPFSATPHIQPKRLPRDIRGQPLGLWVLYRQAYSPRP